MTSPTALPLRPRRLGRAAVTPLVLAALLLSLVPARPAAAAIDSSLERRAIELVNEDRAARGLPRLTPRSDLMETARAWSQQLAKDGRLSHNPALRTDVCCWNVVGENVGTGRTIDVIHRAFIGSEGHRRNIRDTRFTHVGIGVEVDANGRLWVTQVFRRPNTTVPAQAVPVTGDWNGDGRDTPGWFYRGRWYLRNANSTGQSWRVVRFGTRGDVPVVGDWNGDGRDTIGVRRGDRWLLRDTNTSGQADRDVRFGAAGWQPVVGDWNGNGRDGIGVMKDGRWRLRTTPTGGSATHTFTYGRAGDVAVVGDWNGSGRDTPGVRRGTRWLLRDRLTSGSATRTFDLGTSGQRPVVGDWNRDGHDGPGVTSGLFRWRQRDRASAGGFDRSFTYGG